MKNNLKNYSYLIMLVIGIILSTIGAFYNLDKVMAIGLVLFISGLFMIPITAIIK